MLRILGALALLVALACSRAPAHSPAAPKAAAEAPAEAAAHEPPTGPTAKLPPDVLVGVVTRAGERVCRRNRDDEWINVHFQVGSVPIIAGPAQRQLEALRGKMVVLYGRVSDQAPPGDQKPPADAGPCRPEQWRSDWVRGPDGVRIQRGGRPAITAFAVDSLERFAGLQVARSGEVLKVSFENTLIKPLLPPLELFVHYEGCYGKPGSRHQSTRLDAPLAPGETLAHEFPTMIGNSSGSSRGSAGSRKRRGLYAARSVQIRAVGANVYFDANLPLSAAGVDDVDCR